MTVDRSSKPQTKDQAQSFEWNVTIRANEVDFMTTDDEFSAGCNCNCDCSSMSPLPSSARQPRNRRVEGR